MSTNNRSGERGGSVVGNVRILSGGIYGVLSWVVGFIAVAVTFYTRIPDNSLNFQQQDAEYFADFFGWVFYAAHTVDLEISSYGQSQTVNLFNEFLIQDTLVFHAIPAVLLVAAGYAVAVHASGSVSASEGAIAGASVAIGYAAMTLGGALFFSGNVGPASYELPLQQSMLFAGIAFPVVFGGLGGFLRSI